MPRKEKSALNNYINAQLVEKILAKLTVHKLYREKMSAKEIEIDQQFFSDQEVYEKVVFTLRAQQHTLKTIKFCNIQQIEETILERLFQMLRGLCQLKSLQFYDVPISRHVLTITKQLLKWRPEQWQILVFVRCRMNHKFLEDLFLDRHNLRLEELLHRLKCVDVSANLCAAPAELAPADAQATDRQPQRQQVYATDVPARL